MILHSLHIIAVLTLADRFPSITAIHIDWNTQPECEQEEPGQPIAFAPDCRHIISRLPTNLTSATHMPSHYLTPQHPFHPGGYFSHRSCLIAIYLTQDHLTLSSGIRMPSTSPMLREADAFAVWAAIRIALDAIVRECFEQAGPGEGLSGIVGFEASREFDGEVLLNVYGNHNGGDWHQTHPNHGLDNLYEV